MKSTEKINSPQTRIGCLATYVM